MAGTSYAIRLQATGFALDTTILISTRADNFTTPSGTVYHVAKGGSDTRTGTSLAEAFASLGHALSVAQAGATILMHAGRYYEEVTVSRSGSSAAPLFIRNAPGETAVLDGRDTSFKPVWSVHDANAGIYRAQCTARPRLAFHNSGHLFASPTLADLVSNTWSMSSGFFADGSYLYVRLPHAGAPTAGDTVSIPKRTTGITCTGIQYLQIRGLEICYYGSGDYSRGIYFDGASYCLVDSCFLHHSGIGVAFKRACRFNTVQNCAFTESPIDAWNWSAVKEGTGYYEAGGVAVYGSPSANTGNVIRHNRFSHMFDGSHLYSDDASGPTTDMDFHDNTIEFANDDCIETDGAGSNCRIYNNTFRSFLTGVSVAPAAGGPTYIMRNLFTDWETHSGYVGYPVKFNVSSSLTIDWIYLYHNTCYTSAAGQPGFLFKQYSNWNNIISRNNIYAGTDYALQSSSSRNPVDFDYDDLYTSANGRLIDWSGSRYASVSAFSQATGQETHGRNDIPGFSNAAGNDFTLASTSQLIDKGVVIPGINDDYRANGPDIGCYEQGAAAAAQKQLILPRHRLILAHDRPHHRFFFQIQPALPDFKKARIAVYSIQGARVFSASIKTESRFAVWNISRRSSGPYLAEFVIDGKMHRTEFMLMQ